VERPRRGIFTGGPAGAGHFVKMVHNGIEYGIMAAYAEGLNILHHANVGKQDLAVDAETTPLRNPEEYQYDMNLPDISELWRRGSVIASWLLDLTATALVQDPALSGFAGRVSDSGEGRWTSRRRSMRLCRRLCSPRRSINDSVREAKPTLPIRSCPPCATSLEDTSRKGQKRVDRNRRDPEKTKPMVQRVPCQRFSQ